MNNPIFLIKGGIAFPIEKLGFIKRPFAFRLPSGKEFPVAENEQPIFFARKRQKMSGQRILRHYIHRFCVGVKRADGTEEKNWIFPDGSYDVTGAQPSS